MKSYSTKGEGGGGGRRRRVGGHGCIAIAINLRIVFAEIINFAINNYNHVHTYALPPPHLLMTKSRLHACFNVYACYFLRFSTMFICFLDFECHLYKILNLYLYDVQFFEDSLCFFIALLCNLTSIFTFYFCFV